ncbi:MAG: hypothetical protein ACRDYY_05050 [Acidimicrobiales bacterium]
MRSSVADFRVIETVPSARHGATRFLCEPPARLGFHDRQVMVTEVNVDPQGWRPAVLELSRVAAVESPGLLELIEVGPDVAPAGRGVYLASEAAPLGTLAAPTAPTGEADRLRAFARAARAAHALHQAGIAHGAIGTWDIFLTERGAVLGPPPTGASVGVVTRVRDWRDVAVLDPDLLRGVRPSRASDIWALAASLHGALSERPLYGGMANDEPVTAVQRVLFTRPEVDPALPDGLRATLAACFDPDPAERPPTAADLAERLEALEPAWG